MDNSILDDTGVSDLHLSQSETATDDVTAYEDGNDSDDENQSAFNIHEEISAFLFVSSKPLSLEKLVELTRTDEEKVKHTIEFLMSSMQEANLGFELVEINNSFQFRTKPSLTKSLHKLITPKMKRLSKASAESLAVIAYKQPVSKAEIEAIRGVDPLPTIKTLLDGRLIRIVGREDTPGSPALYGTTDHFLERFGFRDLSELPTVKELTMLDDEQSEYSSEEDESETDSISPDESTSEISDVLNAGNGENYEPSSFS
jgi:segregation and condensation protein B